MGTRSAVIIFQDKKPKGYYNQFDGHPDSLGEEVLTELKKIDSMEGGWKQFAENSKKVKLVSESKKPSDELQKKYQSAGFHNGGVSTGSPEEWYSLLRELQGANYLPAILSAEVEHMVDGSNFPTDSLFCEYAYVIDLDKMVVEFYKGFQKKAQTGNRFGTKANEDGYFPCSKVGELALNGISKDELAVELMLGFYEKANKEAE